MNYQEHRFIPTGVGNTYYLSLIYDQQTVHPHGCGEHSDAPGDKADISGSSPRVWGTRDAYSHPQSVTRFIPTGVGNTLVNVVLLNAKNGSSPRVWGTLV